MKLPRVSHPTDRPNFCSVELGEIKIYFSYETPVAFWSSRTGQVVRKNDWGPTTGKHLSWVDQGYSVARIDGERFERQLAVLLDSHTIMEEAV